MVITFYGEGCFKVQSGDFTVLTDPFDAKTGLTPPRFKADVVLKTLSPVSQYSAANPDPQFSINGPGEYNIKDADFSGFFLEKESSDKFVKTVYLAKVEGINLCFLGHVSEALEPAILERLENIDILFIPAGGSPFLNQKAAAKTAKQIEPKMIIPCFFKIPSLKRPSEKIDGFLEEFYGSKKEVEPQEKITVKKKDFETVKKAEIAVLKI